MADKKPTPMNTVAVGIAAAVGMLVYTQISSDSSLGMRIGSGLLAAIVTGILAVGVLTLIRRASNK